MTLGELLAARGLELPIGHVLVSLEERPDLRRPVVHDLVTAGG